MLQIRDVFHGLNKTPNHDIKIIMNDQNPKEGFDYDMHEKTMWKQDTEQCMKTDTKMWNPTLQTT